MSATTQPQKNEAGQPCVEQSHFHFSLDGYEQWFINSPESTVQSLLYQNQNGSQKEAQCASSVSQPPRKDTEPAQSKSVQSEGSKKEVKCAPPHSKPCLSLGTSSAKESSTCEQVRDSLMQCTITPHGHNTLKPPTSSPASETLGPPQKSSADLRQVSLLAPTAPPAAKALQKPTTTLVMDSSARQKSSKTVSSGHRAQASKRGLKPVLGGGGPAASPGPAETRPSGGERSVVPVPIAMPCTVQIVSDTGTPITLKKGPSRKPAFLLQLPAGPLFLVSPQQLSQVFLQPAPGQPTILQLPGGQGSVQGSASQAPAQQNIVINLSKVQGSMEPLSPVPLLQVGPVQGRPEQSLLQRGVQGLESLPQQQPEVRQLATAPCPLSTADASTQTTKPWLPWRSKSYSKGKKKMGKAATPK